MTESIDAARAPSRHVAAGRTARPGGAALRTLGLLGGMGPEATADVLMKIARATSAARDQEHIPIVVRSIPQIPDRTAALLSGGPSPAGALAEGARALRDAGAEFIAIACNTAHHWHADVQAAADRPVLHIADAVAEGLRDRAAERCVGLLATRGALQSGFYQRRLQLEGFEVLTPREADQSMAVDIAIAATKAGYRGLAQCAAETAVERLRAMGAGTIILACTELPVALADSPRRRDVLDANAALARACIAFAGARLDPVHA